MPRLASKLGLFSLTLCQLADADSDADADADADADSFLFPLSSFVQSVYLDK